MAVYRREASGGQCVKEQEKDMVHRPAHYTYGKYECKDVIMDWGLQWTLGNAVKYICRCDHKGNAVEDLEKAIEYIRMEIDQRKRRGEGA